MKVKIVAIVISTTVEIYTTLKPQIRVVIIIMQDEENANRFYIENFVVLPLQREVPSKTKLRREISVLETTLFSVAPT